MMSTQGSGRVRSVDFRMELTVKVNTEEELQVIDVDVNPSVEGSVGEAHKQIRKELGYGEGLVTGLRWQNEAIEDKDSLEQHGIEDSDSGVMELDLVDVE